ncbi:uncharacterized protein UTRI_01028_B [Ustilago trichophora]|uniref:RNA polymerase II assembly factor Rtp1 C-terminal domain-containing protein n=1 Tax=Ustilago trichophora TaxID=86804 RepID=A0A5C3DTI4_9BASI|nr:uncharacterized protein UTRI_01028_B [Ustilago trichophora]
MTDTASSSDTSYRQRLNQALHASRILTGALDDELDIKKSTTTTKLGAQNQAENQAALHATLSDRLRCAVAAWDGIASSQLESDPEVATGDLALHLLSRIHTCLIEKKKDVDSRVVIQDERLPRLNRNGVQPKEDVGLGVKDVKLVTMLQSLASKWALSTRIKAYDQALFLLAPKGFAKAQNKGGSAKLTPHNRFEEVDEHTEVEERANVRAAFDTARKDLAGVVDRWVSIMMENSASTAPGGPVSASTDVVTVMLRVGIVDYLSSLLRLGFGPNVSSMAPTPTTSQPGSAPIKDAIQKRAAAATTQLLRFLSTHSAMSALSSVIAHSDVKLGAPSFVKSVSSRLLSAQLLRPDGVRSLFIITFGGADLAETELDGGQGQGQGTGTAAPGSNSLKRFEQCARLLLTPPQGMPIDVYMPIILPNLLDILAPILGTGSNVTPPPQEQMRAAGFVLTRISERHPDLFSKAMHDRVYTKFQPSPPAIASSKADAEPESVAVTSIEDLDHAISTLSSFLLFSEPSPTFFTLLFEPILPQLLTLYDFLHAPKRSAGKGKIRSLESGGSRDRLKVEVSNFLKTWVRLVDAKHGASSLIRSIRAAETGIGYKPQPDTASSVADGSSELGFFWSEEDEGISIRYGHPPGAGVQDLSTLLKDLSLAALAKQISTGNSDAEIDLTKIAPDLSAKLGLQPDPRLIATLLKASDRKDLARLMLPSVLNIYMAQKSAARARMGTGGGGGAAGAETRSVLYLQLILQLFDAFGSDLLQGDIQATLAFIDFSLSSPSQRQALQRGDAVKEDQKEQEEEEVMPFISAKSPGSQSGVASLFNIASDSPSDNASALLSKEEADDKIADEASEEEEDDEEEEELVSTALSLLLSLLESDTTLSTETQPMLVVIADKINSLLDSSFTEIRSLAKEAKLVLMARRNSIRGATPSSKLSTDPNSTSAKALAYARAQETYQEALKLLQDPILPVRAHGLVLLRSLVSDDPFSNSTSNITQVDPALTPAILDIFLHAVQDEESYLYLNAVQGLSALASSGGSQAISRLVGIYIGRDDGLASQTLPAGEVEKRLRIGEALLQVIQRCGDAMVAHVDTVVPPLLVKLRERALPNVLRSSFVSILGTVVEAAPVMMVSKGYAVQVAEVCMDIVVIEMVPRPNGNPKGNVKMDVQGKRVSNAEVDDEEEEKKRQLEQTKLDSATNTDPKLAHLRRAAMLLLTLLVRGTQIQLDNYTSRNADKAPVEKLSALRLPGGGILPSISTIGEPTTKEEPRLAQKNLLFPPPLLNRLKQVAAYVETSDTDAIVRAHAHDCVQHVQEALLALVQYDLSR